MSHRLPGPIVSSTSRLKAVQNNTTYITIQLNLKSFTATRASFAMSASPKLQSTDEEIQNARAKFSRFRVLVIGRANAGKTTILKRLCNTTGEPMIFSPTGEKVRHGESSRQILTSIPVFLDWINRSWSIHESERSVHYLRLRSINVLTSQRGEHDIENQIIFQGNPGFIFHDSRGFEAGGARELKLVQQFIEKRSKARNVHNQLHAIWCVCTYLYRSIFLTGGKKIVLGRYCIPTSDDRPITAAEKKFFNECGTGIGMC